MKAAIISFAGIILATAGSAEANNYRVGAATVLVYSLNERCNLKLPPGKSESIFNLWTKIYGDNTAIVFTLVNETHKSYDEADGNARKNMCKAAKDIMESIPDASIRR